MSEEQKNLDNEAGSNVGERNKKNKEAEADVGREKEPKVPFRCLRCGLSEEADHFGTGPRFCRKVASFRVPTFVMLDPFSAPSSGAASAGRAAFLVLGGVCAGCAEGEADNADFGVCADCSVFHGDAWLCLDCASQRLPQFTTEVQAKIQKKLQTAAKRKE